MPAAKHANSLTLTRLYDAPVAAVWDAWTDPDQVKQWWGPRGFTLTTHSKDFRVGGHWHYTMHGPDGTDYPNKTVYHVIEKHKKLVYDHGGNDEQAPLFRVTVLFTETAGKTRMDMTMAMASPEATEAIRQRIKEAGGNATWDRLAEHLHEGATGKAQFVINRSFNAPIETVFKFWTMPEHMAQWVPPTGFSMKFIRADIRAGGSSFYSMSNQHFTMYGRAAYLDIQSPHTLIYTQQFCDVEGNISRHPGAPVWPETMLTEVTFTAEGEDQTRVTVIWEPYGDATSEEIAAFIKARGGMTQGWTGSFDKLDSYLETTIAM